MNRNPKDTRFIKPSLSFVCRVCLNLEDVDVCAFFLQFVLTLFLKPPGQGAGDGGAGAPDRPGDHRGDGPSHPHQLLRHAELREPQDGRHQELVAGRPAGREALQRRLQVRDSGREVRRRATVSGGEAARISECKDGTVPTAPTETLTVFFFFHFFFPTKMTVLVLLRGRLFVSIVAAGRPDERPKLVF